MGGAFGVVVLAARELSGASLLHAARTALASGAKRVVVVVGSEAARRGLRGLPVKTVVVHGGRGDSIAAGVAALGPCVEKAVVTLANRARIAPEHLHTLASAVTENRTVVASAYEGVVGAPAAFARSEFPRLLALTGGTGAQSLLYGAFALDLADANVRVPRPSIRQAPSRATAIRRPKSPCPRSSRAPPVSTLVPSSARP